MCITFFQGDDELVACLHAWLDTNKLIVGPLEERGTGWWMTSQDVCFTWVKKKCLNRKCTQVYLIQLLVVQVYSYLVCYFMIVRVEGRDCLGPNSKHSLVPVTIATTVLHHNTSYGIHSNCTLHSHNNADSNKLVILILFQHKFTKLYLRCMFRKEILLSSFILHVVVSNSNTVNMQSAC